MDSLIRNPTSGEGRGILDFGYTPDGRERGPESLNFGETFFIETR